LLINGGLAYLKAADKQGAGSSEQGAKGKEQSTEGPAQGAGSVEQGIQKIRNPQSEIRNIDAPHASRLTPHGIEDAERVFRAAVTANPTNPKPYQQLVTAIYAARKDLAGAKEIISQGIKNGAPPLPLYLSLAEAAQAAGNAKESKAALESAKAEVEKLIKNGESPYTLYIALADGAQRAGDRDHESAALLKALDLQPRSPDVLSRLANLYFEKQNYDRAALYLNRVANINPDSADLYYHLALAEEGRYRFADAGRAYARAVELAPENASYRSRYEEFKARVDRNRLTGDGGQGLTSRADGRIGD
jgi:tetratricopeptide (TPR) repeat protein